MSAEVCGEARLVAFLAGDLDLSAAADVDAHLLGCDACWTAVQEDRRGQAAAESLREPAPVEVRDRLRLAIAVAAPAGLRRRRVRSRGLLVASLAALVAAVVAASVLWPHGGALNDPGSVAAVVRLAAAGDGAVTSGGELRIWRTRSASGVVVVAESASSFPTPRDARTQRRGGIDIWTARRGDVHLLCVMSPAHALLAGSVPDAELAAVARAYGLMS